MNEEEIRKALEIIKQPITINYKEYKYFDQENYDKLKAVYDNCLWFINNFEQINTTVEQLQQENKKLKEDYNKVVHEAKDTLYCWGEVLDPKFQSKMLGILKGGSNNE